MAGRALGVALFLIWAVVATAQRGVDYERQVRPLIVDNCLDCHSADKRKGGLSLGTYADILEGGKDGPIVRPGNGAGSLIVHRLQGLDGEQMPKDGAPLSNAEIALIQRWIDEGARPTPASPAAPQPWEAPLALTPPALPAVVWPAWSAPADRIVAAYLRDRRMVEPALVGDAAFARRAYLDIWGLLPDPETLQAFAADPRPLKRARLVERLLADNEQYAEHWVSFWNDLLRNEDGVNYYSENNGRRSITPWLLPALQNNMSYDRFVRDLLSPAPQRGPEGFLIGVNWRGETSAAVQPWMQASQNTAQLFLGINLKCNSCHDSFVSRWKLKDAYGLAGYFSPEPRLQLYRCDVAQSQYAEPSFLYPELSRAPLSTSLRDRRAAAANIFTDPRNGRMPRTVVNRVWQKLLGHGIVSNADEMDGRPWSPTLLDWLASDFVDRGYDLKHLISTIVLSRAYQMPSVARSAEAPAASYTFGGPEVRRLTAEQFADAIGSVTGEWSVSALNILPARSGGAGAPVTTGAGRAAGPAGPPPSDPPATGRYVREWRNISTDLTRALGRPIRDQVTSVRATEATTPQALELVNGGILTRWLQLGARRMLGKLAPEPLSLYNKAVAGRNARPVAFDIDISSASRLWLLVREQGSNVPAAIKPVWAATEFVTADGRRVTLESLLPPVDGISPVVNLNGLMVPALRASSPSTTIVDIAGKGFARMRGTIWLENPLADIGATLDPQIRFFVFTSPPNEDRLRPPLAGTPLPAPAALTSPESAVTRVFTYLLGRAPSAEERRIAEQAIEDPARPGHASVDGLADLLWALLMKPEFQFVY